VAELNEQQTQDLGDNKKAHRSRSGFWFGIIILLVIIGVAGVGFYFVQGLRDKQKDLSGEVKGEMSKQMSDYQAQLTAIQAQLANVSKELASKDEHFNKTLADFSQLHQEKLNNTQKELTASIQQIQRQLGKTRGDWLIADAEYLLSVANERLQLIGDVHTTLEALEAADQRLRESGDTGVIKIREKIAEEISVVKNVTIPDIVGMYVAIQAQQDHVEQLTLLLPFAGKAPTPDTKNQPETASDDHGLLDAIGIKYSERAIETTLKPEEAKFIYEQLRVKLEIAQIALVQHNEILFQSALVDAKKWIEQHFTKNDVSNNFIAELDKFSAIKIHGQFPDISLSLKMIKDISKLRIEADKATLPTTEPETKKPVEDVKPVDVIKPTKTAPAIEAEPAKKQ
jgi:uroporphyrin-III C-methyltransferase